MEEYMNGARQGWYNPRKMTAPPPRETIRVRRKVFKFSSFLVPSVIFCILGAMSIALAITNLVTASTEYFTDGSGTWVGCKQTGNSIIAPNNSVRGGFFWLFACIGIIIGIWCFLTGLWTGCASRQSDTMLNVLHKVLLITFAGCLLQALFAALDLVASFSCLDTANMTLPSNVKVSMPFFLIFLAVVQIIVTGVLYNLVHRLRRFKMSPYTKRSRVRGQQLDLQPPENVQNGGFSRFIGRPSYNNFMTYDGGM